MPRDIDSRPELDPALAPTHISDAHAPHQAPEHDFAALPTEIAPDSPGFRAPPDRAFLQAGSTFKHYEIIRRLGQGGMGAVFLARDTKLGRLVAIKVLLRRGGADAGRFLAEARATARCKHENIVVIHEVDEIHGTPYMVLEYLEGRTLRDWMAQRKGGSTSEPPARHSTPGPLPPSLAVELILPVVRALGCAHQLGIVHRDLKPENILLTDAGPVKVLDFGMGRAAHLSWLRCHVHLRGIQPRRQAHRHRFRGQDRTGLDRPRTASRQR
jgi:serine/threonine protein kinase